MKKATCTRCRPTEASSPAASPPVTAPLDTGIAGASAHQTYQRLHDRREKDIERRWGRFAGVVKFLSDDPQSIKVWAQGSGGEQILAEHMARALGDRAVLLHDRTVPRTRGNIDHIAVAASGV